MDAKTITAILNVSDIAASFARVRELGLKEVLGPGAHPRSSPQSELANPEIFLCPTRNAAGDKYHHVSK
jgi:hypothetical protein